MTAIDPALEKNYNVRAAIPEHLAVFADWRRRSDAYKAQCPAAQLDLAYGMHPDETLDFLPAAEPGAPIALLIHGGYWQALHKDDVGFAAAVLNTAGVSVAVLNYSLCPGVTLAEIVRQMRRAALWLWQNAAGLGADAGRLYAVGHSAGGHLAALLMCEDWATHLTSAPPDLIKGAVAISGLFDLTPLVETSINHKLGLDRDTAAAWSPVNYQPTVRAAMLLAVGSNESSAFHTQADLLQQAWSGQGIAFTRLTLAGANHLQAFEALAEAKSPLCQGILALMAHVALP